MQPDLAQTQIEDTQTHVHMSTHILWTSMRTPTQTYTHRCTHRDSVTSHPCTLPTLPDAIIMPIASPWDENLLVNESLPPSRFKKQPCRESQLCRVALYL